MPSNCRVEWHFDDPSPVGNTFSFTVRFYQRNGNSYPICDRDEVTVEVTAEGTKKVVAISELGSSTDPNNANEAKVKFSVRTAGQYKISIMIGSTHIAGSPFFKQFIPGPMCANRSRLIRSASIVVCQAGLPNILYIEPRDEYGNICNFDNDSDPIKGYNVEIYDLNDQLFEKYSNAITLSYDKVNSRINVIALFPEPICLRARISYEGQQIPNAYFDIIALSSCDTTLVHKNIASRKHNISYDAKLLSIAGMPKSKPRKVICYIGPKQFTIKEMILKIIPKRIATFRLCPSTKVCRRKFCLLYFLFPLVKLFALVLLRLLLSTFFSFHKNKNFVFHHRLNPVKHLINIWLVASCFSLLVLNIKLYIVPLHMALSGAESFSLECL